jgi:ATP-dependent Clp protease ATP-binding subunit ClpA
VIQRAILHVQSSGKKEVTGANVLVAIFGEKDSHAVYFLQQQGITRLDVVNFISHGITKAPQAGRRQPRARREPEQEASRPAARWRTTPRTSTQRPCAGQDRPADRPRARNSSA